MPIIGRSSLSTMSLLLISITIIIIIMIIAMEIVFWWSCCGGWPSKYGQLWIYWITIRYTNIGTRWQLADNNGGTTGRGGSSGGEELLAVNDEKQLAWRQVVFKKTFNALNIGILIIFTLRCQRWLYLWFNCLLLYTEIGRDRVGGDSQLGNQSWNECVM